MINIRQANGNDVELIASLNSFVQELHVAHMPHLFKPANSATVTEWFESVLESTATRVWIAEVDGTAAGYVLATIHDRPETPFKLRRVYFEIDQISVSPDFRKQGVAKTLVEHVVVEARSHGVSDIELNSWSFNTAAHDAFSALEFIPQRVYFKRTLQDL